MAISAQNAAINLVHNASYLTVIYGRDFSSFAVDTPAGQWRREPDGSYRFWEPAPADGEQVRPAKEG